MKHLAIVLMSIFAAVLYGIIHDQITARICIEYFTIGHPPVFPTYDPTLMGIGWGILATWWVGLILGIALAVCARSGNRPKRSARSLIGPMAILLGATACFAALAGVVGCLAAASHLVHLMEPFASEVPANRHIAFITDAWIHSGSYAAAFAGGILLCWNTWRGRETGVAES